MFAPPAPRVEAAAGHRAAADDRGSHVPRPRTLGRFAARRPWTVIGTWVIVAHGRHLRVRRLRAGPRGPVRGARARLPPTPPSCWREADSAEMGLGADVVAHPATLARRSSTPPRRGPSGGIQAAVARLPRTSLPAIRQAPCSPVGRPPSRPDVVSPRARSRWSASSTPRARTSAPQDLENLKSAPRRPPRTSSAADRGRRRPVLRLRDCARRRQRRARPARRDRDAAAGVRVAGRDGAADRDGAAGPRGRERLAAPGGVRRGHPRLGERDRVDDRARRRDRLRPVHAYPVPRAARRGPRPSRTRSVASLATAGRSVVFAGGTVVVAILGLAVARIPFITAGGIGISIIVLVMVLASITLLPALLGLAGHRVNGATGAAARPATAAGAGGAGTSAGTPRRTPWAPPSCCSPSRRRCPR